MKFSTFFSALVGANMAFAARFTKLRQQRNADQVALRGKGLTLLPAAGALNNLGAQTAQLVGDLGGSSEDTNTTNQNTQYTQNWAGNVLIGNNYRSVSASFVVPTPKTPTGGSPTTTYAASIWVGIDGATTSNSILQTGIDVYVQGTTVGFDAWYEWYPGYAYDFTGITISAGDTIQLTVTASSTTTGTAFIKNVSKGTSVYHSFTTQSQALQEVNAEWIVEDFQTSSGFVPFANFGSVTFTGCTASGPNGVVGPTGGTLLDIQQNGQTLTQSSVSGSSVVVNHL